VHIKRKGFNLKKLIITDNEYLYKNIKKILKEKNLLNQFDFKYSYNNESFINKYRKNENFQPINIKEEKDNIITSYDLILSAHCKQIFPKELVEKVMCVNIHPGYNPYNRGWYPHIFSICNKLPTGATLHIMDEEIDHGSIIFQEKIDIYDWETSLDVYNKILELEIKIIDNYIEKIIHNEFETKELKSEGNINTKQDFDKLCKLDLEEKLTMKEAIDILRALTHPPYKNAYFIDEDKNKIYVKINLTKDDENNYKLICKEDIRGKTPKAYSTPGAEEWGDFVKCQIGPNFKDEINNIFGEDLDKNKYSFKVNMKFFFGEKNFRKADLDNVAKEFLDIIFKSRDGENTGLLLDFDDRVVDEINVKRVFVENEEDEGVYFEIYYKRMSSPPVIGE